MLYGEALLIVEGQERRVRQWDFVHALRHGACVEEETQDAELAYARFPKTEPAPYHGGWLSSN